MVLAWRRSARASLSGSPDEHPFNMLSRTTQLQNQLPGMSIPTGRFLLRIKRTGRGGTGYAAARDSATKPNRATTSFVAFARLRV